MERQRKETEVCRGVCRPLQGQTVIAMNTDMPESPLGIRSVGSFESSPSPWREPLDSAPGTSLAVQWLGLCLPVQGVWVRFLVRGLRPHMPYGLKSNIVTNSIKTFLMVHIKK